MSFIKRTFRPIYHFFLLLRILNVHKTIYINLKYLPWGQALRFPIFVFGRLKIQRSDNGGIEIRHARICRGMIKIGKNIDGHYSHNLPVELILSQKLIFQGYAWISGGTMIETYRGTIDIGNFCVIGSGTMLKSESGIILGNLTRIAYCSTIMDTNVHFIKNTKTGKVNNSSAPISIGIGCWINAFSFISKGAILPNHCITARNSMVNKDYSTVCPPGTFFRLPGKAGVGVQQLEGGRQIVVHKFLQLCFFVRVLLRQRKDTPADLFQPGDLLAHHRVWDGIVHLPQLAQQGSVLVPCGGLTQGIHSQV